MIKSYLKIILGTGLLSPALYFFFQAEGLNPITHLLGIYIPGWIGGILLFNYLENGNGLDFRDKSKDIY